MRILFSMLGVVLAASVVSAQPALDIYHVDVEGGAATLIVTPARESVLVDAGWPGNGGRDVGRIQAAMKAAGVTRIDHLIVTHYHTDHVGGVPPLLAKVPVGTIYDHGLMSPPHDQDYASNYEAYVTAVPQRKALSAGDVIALKPAADATPRHAHASSPRTARCCRVRPRRATPQCGSVPAKPADTSDNARSVAFVLTYGTFDFFDAGDLTWNTEAELVCPTTSVPKVEVYQVTHHGLDASNHPLLLEALVAHGGRDEQRREEGRVGGDGEGTQVAAVAEGALPVASQRGDRAGRQHLSGPGGQPRRVARRGPHGQRPREEGRLVRGGQPPHGGEAPVRLPGS